MSEFSETLSRFIADRQARVYDLVNFLGMDKSTVYQIIKGKRNPPSEVQIAKISDFLQLNPSEREELFTSAQITHLGKNVYYRRKGIEHFLKRLSVCLEDLGTQGFQGGGKKAFPTEESLFFRGSAI